MDDNTTSPSTEADDEFARGFEEFGSLADGDDPAETPENAEDGDKGLEEPNEQDGSETAETEAAETSEGEPEGEQPAADAGDQNQPDELNQLRVQNTRLESQFKSVNGRYQAAERRIAELTQKLEQQQSNPQQNIPSPGSEEFRQSFPDVAEFMDQQAQVIQQLQSQLQGVSASQNDAEARHIESQEQALTAAHPDWPELIDGSGADLQAFLDSPGITRQSLIDFETNRTGIQDASAAARFVGEFKKFLGIEQPVAPAEQQEQQQDTQKPQAGLDAKRKRQLAGATSPRNTSPGVNLNTARGDSFEDGWKLGAGE